MAQTIQLRRDSKVNWEFKNPILEAGELAVEFDTHRFKLGDGVSTYTALPFSSNTLAEITEEFLKGVNITNISYNSEDEITSMTYGNGTICSFAYNANSTLNTTTYTDIDGVTIIKTITFIYDSNDRLIGKDVA